LQDKIFEFYEATTGEQKTEAATKLKGACRALMADVLGKDNADELKALRESGATHDELEAKADQLVAALTDEAKKAKAAKYGPGCKKIYKLASRMRRDHHDDHGEYKDYYKIYLSWLTTEQHNELKQLKEAGKSKAELVAKIMEFYIDATGERRQTAFEKLGGACRELMVSAFGQDKVDEVKAMKTAGASMDAIRAKVNELIDGLDDDAKKSRVNEYRSTCEKIWELGGSTSTTPSSRRRRDQQHHSHTMPSFDTVINTYLVWLTDEQKEELKQMKESSASPESMVTKVIEFYDATEGEVRKRATLRLRGACHAIMVKAVGEQKVNEMKELKQSGMSVDELRDRVDQLIADISDETMKKRAQMMRPTCERVYNEPLVDELPTVAQRVRRHNMAFLNDHLQVR